MNKFKLFLNRKNLAKQTILAHLQTMTRLININALSDIDGYIIKLIDEGKKPSYINAIITTLRLYGQSIGDDRYKAIKYFKSNKSNKQVMSDAEIRQFLELPCPPGLSGVYRRSYAAMSVFWAILIYSGARTHEIANLTIDQVDFGRGVLMVDGKTGKRNVPIHSILVPILEQHISNISSNYLFASFRTGLPVGRATWHYDFVQRIKRLGIKRAGLTPYSFRHSFITRNWEFIDLARLQKIVGHKRISTTLNYTHLVTADIVRAIAKDPLGRAGMSYDDRFTQLRDAFRQALSYLALNISEEKKMIRDLLMVTVE